MNGALFTFEGIEACGKSTQAARLAERLKSKGYGVRLLREPGGTPIGEEIRHTLIHSDRNLHMTSEAELLLMSASRAQLVRQVINPSLAAGEIVVCDRFYDSTFAYQGYGRGLDMNVVESVTEFAVAGTHPDLTILLDISLEESELRRETRERTGCQSRDRLEESDRSFFERVLMGFRAISSAHPSRVRIVDGCRHIDVVGDEVWGLVLHSLQH